VNSTRRQNERLVAERATRARLARHSYVFDQGINRPPMTGRCGMSDLISVEKTNFSLALITDRMVSIHGALGHWEEPAPRGNIRGTTQTFEVWFT